MLVLPSLHYFFFRWSLLGFGFWECLISALKGDPTGDLVLRGFPGPGCPVLCPLELATVFCLPCTGAVKYVAVPLVFGRGMIPSVVVSSWSMGWARLDAQGAVGVLSR